MTFPAGSSATGWTVELYNGSGGARYDSDLLVPNANGVAVVTYAGTLQNGSPDGIALVGPTGTVAEFLSYEGVMTEAATRPSDGRARTSASARRAPKPSGLTLSRRYNTETQALQWFGSEPATMASRIRPTRPNRRPRRPTPAPCPRRTRSARFRAPVPPRPSPQSVTVRGTVVGDVPGFSGFYVQDVDGDGDAATSDGIFVFSPVAVDLGDTVAVKGSPSEFGGQTQISSQRDVEVCADGTAADLPAPAALDLPADEATRERLEGMLVTPVDSLTVSEVFDLTSFGELTLSEDGLLVQPTELARPGTPEAAAIAASNTLRRIVLDDGLSAAGQHNHPPVPVARAPRSGSGTSWPSPRRWSWATASTSGGCSRPTAPPPARSSHRTPARPRRMRWAETSSSARSTC